MVAQRKKDLETNKNIIDIQNRMADDGKFVNFED